MARLGPELRKYLTQHIRPVSPDGRAWTVKVGALSVLETRNEINGTYRELVAQVELLPPAREDVRRFAFHYDAVLHQLVTHKILVSVRQDWAQGIVDEEAPAQVGVIELDIVNNRVLPIMVSLERGSVWTGFGAMVRLGIRHIAEGTDHLLFLLVLLLPAPLLVAGQAVGPLRRRALRVAAVAFYRHRLHARPLAHAAAGCSRLGAAAVPTRRNPDCPFHPGVGGSRPAAFVSGPGKLGWRWVSGLVHGLAFAGTLANLRLDAGPMALSILGFNLGIELMQLLVILLTIPWLMLLSRTLAYRSVRVVGAVVAGLAAIGWAFERVTGEENMLSKAIILVAGYAPYALVVLAVLALFFSWRGRKARELPVS